MKNTKTRRPASLAAAHGSASIRITAGDWGGNYKAANGQDAIKMFFRDILAGKIKLCQLSPLGSWRRADGKEIPFRIAPALFKAGLLSAEGLHATLKAYDLDFEPIEIMAMVQQDAWMLNADLSDRAGEGGRA
jgi:hypothetical protein